MSLIERAFVEDENGKLVPGEIDKVAVAIKRLKMFEPEEGYYVAVSGGKDSSVIYDLVKRSDVKADFHYSNTTIDPPQVRRYIREYQPDVVFEQPKISLFRMMVEVKKIPPLRHRRWCCEKYKENGGRGRFVVTGVRAAESAKRAGRKMVEQCYRAEKKKYLNVIVDWSDGDVWEYIYNRNIPINPLYFPPYNFKRIGCVLCPVSRNIERERQFFPRIYRAWKRAVFACHAKRLELGLRVSHSTADEMWEWWIDRDRSAYEDPDQMVLFE